MAQAARAQPGVQGAGGSASGPALGPAPDSALGSTLGSGTHAAGEPAPRRALLRALLAVWLAHAALGSLTALAYLGDALEQAPVRAVAFACAALVSSVATVLLLPLLPLALLALIWPRRMLLGWAQALLLALAQLLIFADTRVYALFRYHLNGMVWNLLTTPGGEETFELGAGTWVLVAAAWLALLLAGLALWSRLTRPPAAAGRARWPVALRWGLVALLVLVVFEKGVYAAAAVRRDREVLVLSRLFPLYQRFTATRLLARTFGFDLRTRPRVEVAGRGLLLRYPLARPALPPDGPRPNILVIVIDSLRAEMLAQDTMPHTLEWSAGARVFRDHASGGNATRFGVFPLIYGLDGTYWPSVVAEQAPPVLITELERAGYDLRVLSACSQSYPEFRSTCWVTIEDRVEDRLPSVHKHERDTMVGERFDAWLGERETRAAAGPFFGYLLLDSPHQSYDWPRERTRFQPYRERLDYLELSSRPAQAEIDAIFNSYKNAVLHADSVVGTVLDGLRRRGLLESTLVVVTGDHGEEFFEHGYFGHTSNYTCVQVQVAFVLGGPGVTPGEELRPTGHTDLAPTLLELLGADPALRGQWSQGENLLDPPQRRARVVAGWQEVALWVEGGILYVPLEGHKGLPEALGFDWRPHPEGDAFLDRNVDAIARLARSSRLFLR